MRIELTVVPQSAAREANLFRLRPDYAALAAVHSADPELRKGAYKPSLSVAPGYIAHSAVFLDGTWKYGDSLSDRKVMLLSSPGGYGFGMYVLGEALFGRELARRCYPTANIECGVVVPRTDAVMGELARQFNIAVFYPPSPPY
jgi:hypothetical protein